jgi:hypothetical protein
MPSKDLRLMSETPHFDVRMSETWLPLAEILNVARKGRCYEDVHFPCRDTFNYCFAGVGLLADTVRDGRLVVLYDVN